LGNWLRGRLTYANVMASIAVFIALGAGAYAAGLAPNSVKSKHIKDGNVQNQDLANPAVNGSKVFPNSLGGEHIDESTLEGVDADTLDGLDQSDFQLGEGSDVGAGSLFFSGTKEVLGTPDGSLVLQCLSPPDLQLTYEDEGSDEANAAIWVGSSRQDAGDSISAPFPLLDPSQNQFTIFDGSVVVSGVIAVDHTTGTGCEVAISAQANPAGGPGFVAPAIAGR
jgi:hypothetical protein